MNIYTFSPFGYEGVIVSVETDVREGIPAIDIVGLADGAVKESRERSISAITNSVLEVPKKRVLISLSPAELRKEGSGFDLPIALSILKANDESEESKEDIFVVGELELSGTVRPVNGVYAGLTNAIACGIKKAIVPKGNLNEAMSVKGIDVIGVSTLAEAYLVYKGEFKGINEMVTQEEAVEEVNGVLFPKLEEENKKFIGGKESVEALKIAIAGGHHLILIGRYGCGKSRIAMNSQFLLPLLSDEESQSVNRIYSLAGLTKYDDKQIRKRPLRMPHSTATIEGICGGGASCRPGEISLAHNGVLLFDEAMEFRSSVLQMLRVPLESNKITLSRAGRSTVYPAKFQFIATCQPCLCGNFGSKDKVCLCSARAVEMYWKKFSAPLLDRISIRVKCKEEKETFDTKELRSEIAVAYKKQIERQGKRNEELVVNEVEEVYSKIGATDVLESVKSKDYSPRKVYNILRLALTIADLKNQTVSEIDVVEAEKLHNVVPFEA